jgi:hypothetical protein
MNAQSAVAAGWAVQPVPKPARSGATGLSGVSCTSTNSCVAVGWRDVSPANDPVPLVEHWNGSAWSTEQTPSSTASGWAGWLSAVSCASTGACVAVGLSYSDVSRPYPLAERWDGSSWSIERIPHLGDAEALDGVSCASSTDCIAVGYGRSSVATHWNGTRWSAQNIHFGDPGARPNALASVSCTLGSCAAVGWDNVGLCGEDDYNNYYSVPVLGFWTNRNWSLRRHPDLVCSNGGNDHGGYTLDGVSCTSSTACTAVGTGVYRWDGGRWSAQPAPIGADELSGVSCTSTSACTAVGPNIYTWSGLHWSSVRIPRPAHVTTAALSSVSCMSPESCVAVGGYEDRRGRNLLLIDSIGVGAAPVKRARRADAVSG